VTCPRLVSQLYGWDSDEGDHEHEEEQAATPGLGTTCSRRDKNEQCWARSRLPLTTWCLGLVAGNNGNDIRVRERAALLGATGNPNDDDTT